METNIPLVLNGGYIRTHQASTLNENDWINGVIGSYSNGRAVMTWNNINLEMLLGEHYKTNDYFNISLAQIHTIARTGTGTAVLYNSADVPSFNRKFRNLNLYIEGLDFINSTHYQKTGANRKKAILSTFATNVITAQSGGIDNAWKELLNESYYNEGLIFRKQKYVNITIGFGSGILDDYIQNSDYPQNGAKMGNWCIKLNITPINL